MAITNGYASLAEVKAALDITDSVDDTVIEGTIEAVSRAFDNYTGRFFWVDGSVSIRYYQTPFSDRVYTDDISTSTGLIVATDNNGDGTFENTWSASDYNLQEYNAALDSLPYSCIETALQGNYTFPSVKRGVKITAKFGWAAVPKPINNVCVIQSERIFKRFDSPLGSMATNALGKVYLNKQELDSDIEMLLKPYRRLV